MATVKICDICETREKLNTRFFGTGRSPDAAGQMEDDGGSFDLCETCELRVLRRALQASLNSAQVRSLNTCVIEQIKAEKKK